MRPHSAMLAMSLVATLACGGGEATGPDGDNPAEAGTLLITGGSMGSKYQNLYVARDNQGVSGAVVTVNGITIPQISPGQYYGALPDFLDAGAAIRLEVRAGNQTVVGTAIMPGLPVLLTPSPNFTAPLGTPISYAWTAGSSPSRFYAGFLYRTGSAGAQHWNEVSGNARDATVTTTGLPANATDFQAFVNAYADGTFTGPAHSMSRMNVRVESGYRPITLTP